MKNKVTIALALLISVAACGASAGAGGNGSGNPKNDAGHPTKEPIARYIWKEGKLVPNPERSEDTAKPVDQQSASIDVEKP
ncbi:hypothetical secreted protein [Pseudomonas veronii 1YdBTEX2]|jgi:hypothetical protein|uniref:Lipoprotein n=2 Tax=Pseudomonas veronii TaxID=76761 RepID=A0ABS0VUA7_PSEVE|nr:MULTISPECIES: hypothetical protein [Pseudomonas]SBW84078.1 hypothetical secreted protein [Pseudomonas veronii 1YdBTEX2]KAA0941879.1 hypothetical protein FQ182_28540 [Pseudomonas sp. ANT_H4]KAA0944851.1 hypothetical protein FQ186_29155 [Pseudomonas sp. ANT_H14]MBI6552718.1 hypothetical protein [Pseudomonas veronii]MBI6653690.1 hypothetical protein [Pseudomonas veronii]